MRRRWLVLLIGLTFVVNPGAVSACSCVPFSKPELVANAYVIFTGTVTGVGRGFAFGLGCTVSSADPVSVTFDVESIYKGDAPRQVTVSTVASGASCGYTFEVGKRYTVFPWALDGKLDAGLCRGNVEGTIVAAQYGLPEGHSPRN